MMTSLTKKLSVFFFAYFCCFASTSVVVGFSSMKTARKRNVTTPESGRNKKTSSSSNTSTSVTMATTTGDDDVAVRIGKEETNDNSSMAKYLVDLSDAKETFDFCGGMMFQLVLTDALKDHLLSLSSKEKMNDDADVVTVYEKTPRMHLTPGYERTSNADNSRYFHGREIRNVPTAAGGMGMVLQLSLASPTDNDGTATTTNKDPEGWTVQEVDRYDGWGPDRGREWRKGKQLVDEGYKTFRERYGPDAYSLHHRFYLHKDGGGNLWLAAEDGCQGTPANSNRKNNNVFSNLFGMLK